MEGDLDGERAGVLRGVDHGDHARADGDQRQGDLAQWTVSVAWGRRKGGREGEAEVNGQTEARSCTGERMRLFSYSRGQREYNPQS